MICTDLHTSLSSILSRYDSNQVVFVYDKAVPLAPIENLSPLASRLLPLSVSEATKTLATVERIWQFLLERQITRQGLIVAIGGGVLTDLAGFAAATYKRGMDYINLPTTLLAMVDASTGGKTGFDYGGIKNSIGAFHQPVATLVYPGWLETLPPREWLCGYAEMLKTALITSSDLWNRLIALNPSALSPLALSPLIADCMAAKQQIVAADPREKGLRKALNFGHTFGHALEEIQLVQGKWPNDKLSHGYAVLYGLIAELYLSVTLLGFPREPLQQLTQIMLHDYGRPQCKCSDLQALVALMRQDKKNEHADEINCTLLRSIGDPVVNCVLSDDQAAEAWDYLFSL